MGERPISRMMERCKSRGKDSTGVIQGGSRVEVGTARKRSEHGQRMSKSTAYLRSLSGFGDLSSGSRLF